jgi:hypothetical protein
MSADGTKQTAVVYYGYIYISCADVGIGTTTPSQRLHVKGNTILEGSVGIGTASFDGALNVEGRICNTGGAHMGSSPSSSAFFELYNEGWSGVFQAYSISDDLLFRIDDDGYVAIGVYPPTEKLDVAGTARLRGIAAGSGTTVVADNDGKLWKQSSSQRYKTNIETLDADTDGVLCLRPVRFQWKTTGQEDMGLIAEEVEKVSKDLVIYDNEGRPDGVKYDKVALYLLSIVKKQQKENEDIKNRLAAMESLVTKLSLKQEGGIK